MADTPENFEGLIFGTENDRRYTQDSPILPDVWLEYAKTPNEPVDLLLTPHRDMSAGQLANAIRNRLSLEPKKHKRKEDPGNRFCPRFCGRTSLFQGTDSSCASHDALVAAIRVEGNGDIPPPVRQRFRRKTDVGRGARGLRKRGKRGQAPTVPGSPLDGPNRRSDRRDDQGNQEKGSES